MSNSKAVNLIISDIGMNGEGIARMGGNVFFVPFALTGEKVTAGVVYRKKNLYYAKLMEVHTPADERVRPKCAVFGKCGGCQLQHLKYTVQLRLKSKLAEDCFRKVARICVTIPPTVKSDPDYGYRNKLQIPVGRRNGENICGFYAPGTHRIVRTDSCPLHPDWAGKVMSCVLGFMDDFAVKGYDEERHDGLVRHILVREVAGRLMITLVINGGGLPNAEELYRRLSELFDDCSLYINLNSESTNVITGEDYVHIGGEPLQRALSLGVNYNVHPASFLQVNTNIRDKIYQKVHSLCAPGESSVIIDAYSGAGLLSAYLARHCKLVYGIEIIKEAVENANRLAYENNLMLRMKNICGACEDVLPRLIDDLRALGKSDISVVLDPPRKGCDRKVLEALLVTRPEKIVYISCNPATLARDIGILLGTLTLDGAPIPGLDTSPLSYPPPADRSSCTSLNLPSIAQSGKADKVSAASNSDTANKAPDTDSSNTSAGSESISKASNAGSEPIIISASNPDKANKASDTDSSNTSAGSESISKASTAGSEPIIISVPVFGKASKTSAPVQECGADVTPEQALLTQSAAQPNTRYRITFIQTYDMFPMTKHVECVVLMSRVE